MAFQGILQQPSLEIPTQPGYWKSLHGTVSFYSGKDSTLLLTYWPNFRPFRTFKSTVILASACFLYKNVMNQSKHEPQHYLYLLQVTHESGLFCKDSVGKAGVLLKHTPPADDLHSEVCSPVCRLRSLTVLIA